MRIVYATLDESDNYHTFSFYLSTRRASQDNKATDLELHTIQTEIDDTISQTLMDTRQSQQRRVSVVTFAEETLSYTIPGELIYKAYAAKNELWCIGFFQLNNTPRFCNMYFKSCNCMRGYFWWLEDWR